MYFVLFICILCLLCVCVMYMFYPILLFFSSSILFFVYMWISLVAHRISFTDFHVDWSSATEIHLYSKAVSHKLMRSVSQRLGFQTGE